MAERTQLIERELDTLYQVSQVLNSTRNLKDKLQGVLDVLHEGSDLRSGILALREQETDALVVCAVHGNEQMSIPNGVRYEPGEGLMGIILDAGHTQVVERIADEPRFLGRLGLYDPDLPFIGSPIRINEDELVGVLAAQPLDDHLLGERARFMEMVANLIAQSVGLLRKLEQQQRDLTDERDQLKQSLR